MEITSPQGEFRECVLEAYQPLLDDADYQELPQRDGGNPYSVRIGNKTTVIEVEGIHYGSSAWTKILRASDAHQDYYGVPIWKLINQRDPKAKKRKKKETDQLEEIRQDALFILANAADVLTGNFSAINEIEEKQRHIEEEYRARQPSPEEKAANVAASEAGHHFKAGDFQRTVDLLAPHFKLLNKPQKKRYEIALSRITTKD